jgi:plasmid stability protein
MNRTTLSLPDDLASALKREARRRHTSVSSVAREALSDHFGFGGEGPREVPFAAIVSDDDPSHAAARMEESLGEIIEDAYQDAFGDRRR